MSEPKRSALSSLLPYALEAISLRRLRSGTFAVLMSLAPAVAATTGAVLLDQQIDAIGALAIVCVVGASAGAVAASVRRAPHDHQSPRPSAQPSSLQDRQAVFEWAAEGHHRSLDVGMTPRRRPRVCGHPPMSISAGQSAYGATTNGGEDLRTDADGGREARQRTARAPVADRPSPVAERGRFQGVTSGLRPMGGRSRVGVQQRGGARPRTARRSSRLVQPA